MTFNIPSDIAALDTEALTSAINEALEDLRPLADVDESEITDEQIEHGEALTQFITAAREAQREQEAAAQARADRIAAVRAEAAANTPPAEEEEPDEQVSEFSDEETSEAQEPEAPAAGGDGAEAEESDEPPVAVETQETPEMVTASAPPENKEPTVKQPAGTPQPDAPEVTSKVSAAKFTAAAGLHEFAVGADLDRLDLAKAAIDASRSYDNIPRGVKTKVRNAFATLHRPVDSDLEIQGGDSQERQREVVEFAANERRLGTEQGKGSLVAAGGWCAPSETLYDYLRMSTDEGLLNISEITLRRGGINHTMGPDFSALYTDLSTLGGIQTEAEAEAGTEKTCEEITCPEWLDERADAVYLCVTAPILTRHAYPELVRDTLDEFQIAYQHKINSVTLSRIQAKIGAAQSVADVWANAFSVLHALEMVAEGVRTQYRLSFSASMEVVLPHWIRPALRADLANRTGVDTLSVTNQQLDSHFRARGLLVQFVYDWQGLALAAAQSSGRAIVTDYPDTVEALIYPAGTYVRANSDIIRLETIYDSTLLATNTYTALFAEQDLLVLERGRGGRRVSIPLAVTGRTGAADLSHDFGTAPVAP